MTDEESSNKEGTLYDKDFTYILYTIEIAVSGISNCLNCEASSSKKYLSVFPYYDCC